MVSASARPISEQLANLRSRRAAFRSRARQTAGVTNAMFRVLDALLERADSSLDNSYPQHQWILEHVGGNRTDKWLQKQITALVKIGLVERPVVTIYRSNGTRTKGAGALFTLPPGPDLPEGWRGPSTFANARKHKARWVETKAAEDVCPTERRAQDEVCPPVRRAQAAGMPSKKDQVCPPKKTHQNRHPRGPISANEREIRPADQAADIDHRDIDQSRALKQQSEIAVSSDLRSDRSPEAASSTRPAEGPVLSPKNEALKRQIVTVASKAVEPPAAPPPASAPTKEEATEKAQKYADALNADRGKPPEEVLPPPASPADTESGNDEVPDYIREQLEMMARPKPGDQPSGRSLSFDEWLAESGLPGEGAAP